MCIPLNSNINVYNYNYIDKHDIKYVHSTYLLSKDSEKMQFVWFRNARKKVFIKSTKRCFFIFRVLFLHCFSSWLFQYLGQYNWALYLTGKVNTFCLLDTYDGILCLIRRYSYKHLHFYKICYFMTFISWCKINADDMKSTST